MHHVGSIQPAAQAYLQHGPLDAVFREILERQRGHHLEGRDLRDGFDGRLAAIEQRHQVGLSHQPAAQPDALAEGVEVGGGVDSGVVTGRAQDRLHHHRSRAFALGAGDMDAPEAVLRAAQPFEHLFHAAQVERHRVVGVANLLLIIDVTENVIQGILVKAHISLRGRDAESYLLRDCNSSASAVKTQRGASCLPIDASDGIMPFSAAAIPGKRCDPRADAYKVERRAKHDATRTTRGRGYLLAQTHLGSVHLPPARSHPHLAAGRAPCHARARRRHRRSLPRLEPVVGQARAGGFAPEPIHLRLAVLADRHQPGFLHADAPERDARRPPCLRARRNPDV